MDNLDIEKKLKEWWIQRRQFVIAVGLFLSSVLLLFFGAYRFWQIAEETQVTIEQKQKELNQVVQRATLLNTITPDDRAGYILVEQALPRFKEPLQVMRTLEAISQDTQISLGEYDLNPGVVSTEAAKQSGSSRNTSKSSKSKSQFQSLRFEIDASGSFQQLTTAIDYIEQSLPLMEVTDLRIAPARRSIAGDLTNVEYTATLQLESYYLDIDAGQTVRAGAQQVSPGQRRARETLQNMKYWLESRTSTAPQNLDDTGNNDLFQLTQ